MKLSVTPLAAPLARLTEPVVGITSSTSRLPVDGREWPRPSPRPSRKYSLFSLIISRMRFLLESSNNEKLCPVPKPKFFAKYASAAVLGRISSNKSLDSFQSSKCILEISFDQSFWEVIPNH